MRVVIDMQGAQTASRFRGIGRYTLAFAQAVVRNRGEHEIILALSGLFPETIEPIRAAFDGLLPQENIRVWHAPGPVKEEQPGNDTRREAAELIREAFLAGLQPDVIHITSLFEGYVDDAVTSVGRFDTATPVSVTLYDLIPLLNPDHYLKPLPRYEQYYLRKVEYLKKAVLHLAISEFSRQEGIDALGTPDGKTIAISTALDSPFQPQTISDETASELRARFGITRPFVLFTGATDERKNLPRLIKAYADLSDGLRRHYQLVLAGGIPQEHQSKLRRIASKVKLRHEELIMTGWVSDKELVQLYNLCHLYVFPSWHEGFGLPVLEAMACGAPVIGANTSSLPEVIGLEEALFDPFDVKAITAKLTQALEDEAIRNRLREHGLNQAKKFSWEETAKRAIAAWESMPGRVQAQYLERSLAYNRLLAALAKPLVHVGEPELVALSQCVAQNESIGIERQLFLDVSELCQHDAATSVQRVVRSYLKQLLQSPPTGFRVEPVYATRDEGYRYARSFTQRFLDLDEGAADDTPITWQRGDVFFGLDMQHHVQLIHAAFFHQLLSEGVVVKFLVHDLLSIQLADLFKDSNAKELYEQWLAMIAATDGAICISKATADAFEDWMDEHTVPRSPTFRTSWVHIGADIDGSCISHGLPDDAQAVLHTLRERPTFLCVSTIEPRKKQQQILEAVEQLWQDGEDVNLVLVGKQGWKAEAFADRLLTHPEKGCRLLWLEGISEEYLDKVYAASTCLIAASLNEGFGLPLIEAVQHGISIIARDIPVFREAAGEYADYFRGETPQDLAGALKVWLERCRTGQPRPESSMPWSSWQQSTEELKYALLEQNYPRRQLLVDISELVQRDARTGIQRVVRSILKEWLLNPPDRFRVQPVYATVDQPYRYARRFTAEFLNASGNILADEPIDYAQGDIFLGLDFQPEIIPTQQAFYQNIRRKGVHVSFVVYDLLSVQMPQRFPVGAKDNFEIWLQVVTEGDSAICISKSVANELDRWIKEQSIERERPFSIDWFHLGTELVNSGLSGGDFADNEILSKISAGFSFLMVGTLEPRKGHELALDAFEILWKKGFDHDLVIVGKCGWMVEELVDRIQTHPELNRHLFWLEDINDEYLERVYTSCSCLLFTSEGEGFGLPLVEAAQRGLPIIARNLPVVREVAGDNAFYFDESKPSGLAKSIEVWLEMYAEGTIPQPHGIPIIEWDVSARMLFDKLMCCMRNQAN